MPATAFSQALRKGRKSPESSSRRLPRAGGVPGIAHAPQCLLGNVVRGLPANRKPSCPVGGRDLRGLWSPFKSATGSGVSLTGRAAGVVPGCCWSGLLDPASASPSEAAQALEPQDCAIYELDPLLFPLSAASAWRPFSFLTLSNPSPSLATFWLRCTQTLFVSIVRC